MPAATPPAISSASTWGSEPVDQPAILLLELFDGRSARPQPVQAWVKAGTLQLRNAEGQVLSYPLRRVRWPERQRHGQRQAQLPDGGVLSGDDARAWDQWARASGLRESLLVRWMQSWRRVAVAMALLVATTLAIGVWGIPLASDALVAVLPPQAEQMIGERALAGIDARWLKPSTLPPARREAITADFAALLRTSPGTTPDYRLHFRSADKSVGPNALALPGGHIVLTDALAQLLSDQPDALAGVLAHELGHVQRQHGMRMVVQASLLASLNGLIIGDFSGVLVSVPTLLGQQAYSRDFEREADAYARDMLRAAGRSPTAMLVFFERIESYKKDHSASALPIALASHPANEERKRFFGAAP